MQDKTKINTKKITSNTTKEEYKEYSNKSLIINYLYTQCG